MAGQGTVTIRILGDAKDLKSALGESDRALGSFSDKMQSAGSKIAGVGAKITAGVTLPLVALGKVAFDAASDLNESMSKATVVFGDWSDGIMELGDRAATSLGMSKQAAIEATGTFGNLFRSMEFSKGESAKLSANLVQLAADLASFNNADPAEVLENLRSGLLGEAEPLRKFGVQLSQTRIEAEALSMGLVAGQVDADKFSQAQIGLEKAQVRAAEALKKGGAESLAYRDAVADVATAEARLAEQTAGKVPELTAAQKTQAAYSIIMKDTALAQGDFARTADGAANKQRILKAQFEDAAATIGNKLMPIGQKLMGWVSQLITNFSGLSDHTQNIILVVAGLAAAVGPLTTVIGGLVAAIGFLVSPVGLAVAAVAALAAGIIYLYTHSRTFRDVVAKVADVIKAVVTPIIGFFADHLDQLKILLVALGVVLAVIGAAFVATIVVPLATVVIAVTAAVAAAVLFIQALQWLWDKLEPVRTLLGDVASVATGLVVAAFYAIRDAVGSATDFLVDLWEKSEPVRAFLADAFTSALGALQTAFDQVRGAVDWLWSSIQSVIDAAVTAIDFVSRIPVIGGGGGGLQRLLDNSGVIGGGTLQRPGANAAGTSNWRGGWSWVGERGPELLKLPAGSQVRSNAQSMAMAGGGPTYNFTINTVSSQGVKEAIRAALAEDSRRNGGALRDLVS